MPRIKLAPSLANKYAAARPIPELAPVTMATFFARTPISNPRAVCIPKWKGYIPVLRQTVESVQVDAQSCL